MNEYPSRYWKYWTGRLIICHLQMLIGCTVGFPIVIYLVIPSLGLIWGIPFTWPTPDYLMKWVRYGVFCIFWVGTISWLGEFVPWLIGVIRSRKP